MKYQVGAEYEFIDNEGTGYAGILTDTNAGTLVFDLFDGSDIEIDIDTVVSVELLKAPKVYEEQEYVVKFDMGNPVDVTICVHHENQTKLTRQEIIQEALGYAEEVGFDITEQQVYEIIATRIVEDGTLRRNLSLENI